MPSEYIAKKPWIRKHPPQEWFDILRLDFFIRARDKSMAECNRIYRDKYPHRDEQHFEYMRRKINEHQNPVEGS